MYVVRAGISDNFRFRLVRKWDCILLVTDLWLEAVVRPSLLQIPELLLN